jgi:glycosyltransferase involved in cell wall biosynthesis
VKFCLVTSFYPPYHFGGDAIFVAHLADELGRRGHVVDVVHDVDAYRLFRSHAHSASRPARPNVTVHPLSSPFGRLSPLVTQQTGRPWLNPGLRRLLEQGAHDVVHFHNASLIGPGAFSYGRAVKLYTTHEQWLVCQTHLLWKFGREICERPACVRCSLLAGRPPQWWRMTGFFLRQLQLIDRVIAPNAFIADLHRARGLDLPFTVLQNFVPASWTERPAGPGPGGRSYFLFSGRLTAIKGLQTILGAFRRRPDLDLLVAGDGDSADEFRAAAADLPNIRFLGHVAADVLRSLYAHAVALIVPSLVYEVTPLVALEAFSQGTPAIVREVGGLADVVHVSGGGLLFRNEEDLLAAMDRLRGDRPFRDALGQRGFATVSGPWSADAHISRYLDIVQACIETRARRARG